MIKTTELAQTQFLDFLFGPREQDTKSLCSNNFHLQLRLDQQTDEIVFDITLKEASWFGIGYSCTMTESDMLLVEADQKGRVKVTDLFSRGPFKPDTDRQQDYKEPYGLFKWDDSINFKTRRLVDTFDSQDFVIPLDEPFVVNWAGCPCSDHMNYHGKNIWWLLVRIPSNGENASMR